MGNSCSSQRRTSSVLPATAQLPGPKRAGPNRPTQAGPAPPDRRPAALVGVGALGPPPLIKRAGSKGLVHRPIAVERAAHSASTNRSNSDNEVYNSSNCNNDHDSDLEDQIPNLKCRWDSDDQIQSGSKTSSHHSNNHHRPHSNTDMPGSNPRAAPSIPMQSVGGSLLHAARQQSAGARPATGRSSFGDADRPMIMPRLPSAPSLGGVGGGGSSFEYDDGTALASASFGKRRASTMVIFGQAPPRSNSDNGFPGGAADDGIGLNDSSSSEQWNSAPSMYDNDHSASVNRPGAARSRPTPPLSPSAHANAEYANNEHNNNAFFGAGSANTSMSSARQTPPPPPPAGRPLSSSGLGPGMGMGGGMAHPGMDRRYSISDSDEGSEGLVGMDTLRGFGGGGSHLTESDGSPPSHDGSGAGDRPWSSSLSGSGSAGPKPRAMGSVGLSSQHRAQQAPPRAQTPMAVRHGAVDGSWLSSSQGGGGGGGGTAPVPGSAQHLAMQTSMGSVSGGAGVGGASSLGGGLGASQSSLSSSYGGYTPSTRGGGGGGGTNRVGMQSSQDSSFREWGATQTAPSGDGNFADQLAAARAIAMGGRGSGNPNSALERDVRNRSMSAGRRRTMSSGSSGQDALMSSRDSLGVSSASMDLNGGGGSGGGGSGGYNRPASRGSVASLGSSYGTGPGGRPVSRTSLSSAGSRPRTGARDGLSSADSDERGMPFTTATVPPRASSGRFSRHNADHNPAGNVRRQSASQVHRSPLSPEVGMTRHINGPAVFDRPSTDMGLALFGS